MARESLIESTQAGARDELPSPPARFHRPATVFLGLLFLFVPSLAYLVGVRAEQIENRPLAKAPSVSDGWGIFDATSTWFTDHLPLRREAIRANSSISRQVFREEPSYGDTSTAEVGAVGTNNPRKANAPSTYPTVVSGRDGWLFLGEDFQRACEPALSIEATLARIARLDALITNSGRRFVFTVAPDKSTMEPEYLPSRYVGKDCTAARKDAFWAALERDAPPSYFDVRGPLEQQQQVDGTPIYRRLDTHWTRRGSTVYARALSDALDPALWGDTAVVAGGTMQVGGDLARLLGEQREEAAQQWNVVRPGVQGPRPALIDETPNRIENVTTGAPLFQPRVLLLGDSFTQSSIDQVSSLFANVVELQHQHASAQTIAQEIASADVVVYEVVERGVIGGTTSILSDRRLAAIEAALNAAPPGTAPR